MSKSKQTKNKSKQLAVRNTTTEFLVFSYQSGGDGVDVLVNDGTIWLTQKLMSKLFDTTTDNIGLHLKNIFKEEELDTNSVTEKYSVTAADGKNYNTLHYNLDAIIAIGYRVNTKKATAFRQWATNVLRDYTLRGYLVDRKRMENGAFFDDDYFERLLEEIREIRLSERRFYQKITDLYSTALDYNADAKETKKFFKRVQNKLHYAIHGQTAAEVIYYRADAEKDHMGLTSWEKSPHGKIVKTDVLIAKNYLTQNEVDELGRLVNGYLDFAENRARRKIPMTMADWELFLSDTLRHDLREVLQDAGRITADLAKKKALSEFEKYRPIQDRLFKSDYDIMIELEEAVGGTEENDE